MSKNFAHQIYVLAHRAIVKHYEQTLTKSKSLAQILSRDIDFYNIVATRKGYLKTITLSLTLAFIRNLTPSLIPTLTLTQALENEIFASVGHLNKTFFAHNF